MHRKKAQMFVVTAVFLASMLFVVQQALITYSALDMSGPFKTKQLYMLKNIVDSINRTIKNPNPAITCQDFDKNLDELLSLLKDDASSEGYLLETDYYPDCSSWDNEYPQKAPLTLRFSETYDASGNILKFYHKPLTERAVCQAADNADPKLCDGLDLIYGTGYELACCDEYPPFCCP